MQRYGPAGPTAKGTVCLDFHFYNALLILSVCAGEAGCKNEELKSESKQKQKYTTLNFTEA